MGNGHCSEAGCSCKEGWTGPHCGALDLEPARLDSGYRSLSESSWGGTVVTDPTKPDLYHLLFAKMISNCGLTTWKTNSVIAHAVSSSPTGPFASPRSDGFD